MEIEITGHSGCLIEIENGGEGLFIVKSTYDPAYAGRLKSQALKQQSFQPPVNSSVKAPRILRLDCEDSRCSVRMEYVYSLNSIAFFENAGFAQISNFMEGIIDYVVSEISLSELRSLDDGIIRKKYAEVKGRILANRDLAGDEIIRSWFPALDGIFAKEFNLRIPIGVCHGDLTFSNILFSGNSFYLIDFLDSFVETPLIDIVKLRQDTAFDWSGLMYTGTYDRIRHDIVLKFMDRKIEGHFSAYPWYRDAYGIFQLMNFLRILQYAREPRVADFLKSTINRILESYGK